MSKQRLLLLPCHSILEYDDVKMFSGLGYEVFSPGSYICDKNPGDPTMRPTIPGFKVNPDLNEQWHKLAITMPGQDPKYNLSRDFVQNNFDVIIVTHIPEWVSNNWEAFRGKRVIWRTIGQSISVVEDKLRSYRQQGLEIVRYSPMEEKIPGYIGSDAMIRFGKDPAEYPEWKGSLRQVVTFAQSMKQRDAACNFSLFELVTRPFPRKLYGPGNQGSCSGAHDKVTYEEQKKILCDSKCYFATGTHPASYTLNFIEAWLSGIPVVTIGPGYGNAKYFPGHELYEVHQLVQTGVNGFVSDSPVMLQQYIRILLDNESVARSIGSMGRQEAIRHFDKAMISAAWDKYLEGGK